MSKPLVLDTNIVLDLFVFDDPAVAALKESVLAGRRRWIATEAMRTEFERVLGYPNITSWLARRGIESGSAAADALARFDQSAQFIADAPTAPVACRDPDDQIFIDLALAHGAELVSKDRAVMDAWRRANLRGARR